VIDVDARMRQIVKSVAAVLILLAFAALGLALACDFRGVADDYATRSLAAARPIGDLLRRDQTPEAAQRRLARVTVIQRIIGLVFALASLAIPIAVIATT
jgi:hypothetical protein